MKNRFANQEDVNKELDLNRTDFSDCIFDCEILFKKNNLDNCYFNGAIFRRKLRIYRCKPHTISFSKVTFMNDVEIEESEFYDKTDFFRAIFMGKIICNNSSFHNVIFDRVAFKDQVLFDNIMFKDKVSFGLSLFSKLSHFEDSVFETSLLIEDTKSLDQLSFRNSFFLQNININRSSFNKRLDFEGALINKLYCNTSMLYSNIIFSNVLVFGALNIIATTIQGVLDIEQLEISNAKQEIESRIIALGKELIFEKFASFKNENVVSIDFTDSIFYHFNDKSLVGKNFKNRETIKAIKHSFFQSGDTVKGMRYFRMEMIQLKKEVRNELYSRNRLSIVRKSYLRAELFMLNLNELSNKTGNSWLRGVLFTFVTTSLFFTIFIFMIWNQLTIQISWSTTGDSIKAFLQFVNVTNWNYHPYGVQTYSWAYVPLFFGRIFISFGIYQTIQAFRKYGKD